MYISEKYWDGYIGGTDDSLTLLEYLAEKQREEIPLGEVFSDFGLNERRGDFRTPDIPIVYASPEGWETSICCAIDLISDLAALLLECKVSGSVDLRELSGLELPETTAANIRLTATPEEHAQINQALRDFSSAPLAYDLSEMLPEEEILEMAVLCGELREELYGQSLSEA